MRLLLLMLAPEAPHIAEELWSRRLAAAGEAWRSIHTEAWPAFDESLVAAEMIELPVQVNGKLRDKVSVAPGLPQDEIEAIVMAQPKVMPTSRASRSSRSSTSVGASSTSWCAWVRRR